MGVSVGLFAFPDLPSRSLSLVLLFGRHQTKPSYSLFLCCLVFHFLKPLHHTHTHTHNLQRSRQDYYANHQTKGFGLYGH